MKKTKLILTALCTLCLSLSQASTALALGTKPTVLQEETPKVMQSVTPATLDIQAGNITLDGTETSCPGHVITGTTEKYSIKVTGGTHNITLHDANINVTSAGDDASAFAISPGAIVNLTLQGSDNKMISGDNKAGIRVPETATLSITAASTGSLSATSFYGAGIGGDDKEASGTINISGGSINVFSQYGAGIGGGKSKPNSDINISGGTIYAISNFASGIGGGQLNNSKSGSITITGGSIYTVAFDSSLYRPVEKEISGTANSKNEQLSLYKLTLDGVPTETAIDSLTFDPGYSYGMKDVETFGKGKLYVYLPKTQENAKVTATIGNEKYVGTIANHEAILKKASNMTTDIATQSITLEKGLADTPCKDGCTDESPHIIVGTTAQNNISVNSGSHHVLLQNVSIEASQSAFSIQNDATVNLKLSGDNSLKSGAYYSGLQVSKDATLTISGPGSLTATGGAGAAGIGGSMELSACGNINITGGKIIATGGQSVGEESIGGPGIGGIDGKINISGGQVIARGSYKSAGIGGAEYGSGNDVVITGGSILAIGDKENGAMDIGKGANGLNNGTLTNGTEPVYLNTLTLYGITSETSIENLTFDPAFSYNYGLTDVKTDANGKLYFYLPKTSTSLEAKITSSDQKEYRGIIKNNSGAMKKVLVLNMSSLSLSKEYDGTPLFTEANANTTDRLIGLENNDAIKLNFNGYVTDVNVGEGKQITLNLSLEGTNSENYYLSPTILTSNVAITQKTLSIEDVKYRINNGTPTVTSVTLGGLVEGETLVLNTDYTASILLAEIYKTAIVTFTPQSDKAKNYSFRSFTLDLASSNSHNLLDTINTEINGDSDLVARFQGDMEHLKYVFMDDKVFDMKLDGELIFLFDYGENVGYVKPGSVIVTLYKDYLKTLSPGPHTLTVTFDDDGIEGTGSVEFIVVNNESPETGDNTSLEFNITLLVIGLLVMGGSLLYRKRSSMR